MTTEDAPEPKIVITGTGRAGTTVLVRMLTRLGLDTGETSGALSDEDGKSHGGLEFFLDAPGAPTVVKDTSLPFRLGKLLEDGAVSVEHAIIPIRRLDVAAASRVRASNYGRNILARGGLWGTVYPHRQRDALAGMLYELMYTLARFEIPHTLLEFPRFTTDADYTYRCLSFLAPDRSPEDFREVLAAVVRPELIHQHDLEPRERRWARRQSLRLRLNGTEKRVNKVFERKGDEP